MAKDAKRFVSYSINFEDVILRRIFAAQAKGFFVDVGAADPIDDNDMYALSRLGWAGINVEPNPSFFRRLEAERIGDCNLNLAISDRKGTIDWYQVENTGLSTCDREEACRAADKGYSITRYTVPTTTLAQILADAAPESIDILKVDVEGLELEVLRGNDWAIWRPKVVFVEATLPDTRQRRPDAITPFLKEQGYRHAYFDGLNDWFVEASFEPPADAFLPPNIFDCFVRRGQAELEAIVEDMTKQVHASQEYTISLQSNLEALGASQAASTAANVDLNNEIGRLRSEAIEVQAQLHRLGTEAAEARENAHRFRAEMARADGEARRMQAVATESHQSTGRIRAAMTESLDRYAALSTKFEAVLRTIAENEAAAGEASAKYHSEISQLHMILAEAQDKLQCSETALIQVQTAAAERDANAAQASAKYHLEISQLHMTLAETQDKLLYSEAASIQVQEEIESTCEELMRVTAGRDALRSEAMHFRNVLTTKVSGLQQKNAVLAQQLTAAEMRSRSLMDSTSWRVTRPIRVVARLLRPK